MISAQFAGHWLTVATCLEADAVCDLIPGGFSQVELIGGFNQPRSRGHESGARVYFGSPRDAQPVVLNLPGEVCEHWWDEGLAWAAAIRGRITREDVACDVYPAEQARLRMLQMRREWKSKRVGTHVRRFSEHRSDPPEGWTHYYGSSQSRLRTRVYDKRGPLRIEKQWRPERESGQLAIEVTQRQGVAPVWRALSGDLRFKLPWYQELLAGETVTLPAVVEQDSSWCKFMDQLRLQYGPTMYALRQLGVDLAELAVEPEAPLDSRWAATWLRRAEDAQADGYDGAKLIEEIKWKLSLSRKRT